MKNLLILLFLIVTTTVLATVTITETPIDAATVTIGAGLSATYTLPVLRLDADSIAFQLELDKSDVSGTITYEYISRSNKTNNLTLSSLPQALTLDSGMNASFGEAVPVGAGKSRIRPYLILTNLNVASQAIGYSVIAVKTQK
jgi:hypothetical protein